MRDGHSDGQLRVCGYAGLKNVLVSGVTVPVAALDLIARATTKQTKTSTKITNNVTTSTISLPSTRLALYNDWVRPHISNASNADPAPLAAPISLVVPSPAAPAAPIATPLLSASHDSATGHLHGSLLYALATRARRQAGHHADNLDERADNRNIPLRSITIHSAARTPSLQSLLAALATPSLGPSLVLASGAHYLSPLSPLKAPPAALAVLAAAFAAPVHGYSYSELSLCKTLGRHCPVDSCRCADSHALGAGHGQAHDQSNPPPPWQRLATSLLPLLPYYDSPHTPTADLCLPGALAATVLHNFDTSTNKVVRGSSTEVVLPFSLPGPATHPFICAGRYSHMLFNGVTTPSQMCHLCRVAQPHKSRHCNKCNRCVYRFDHHCPWVDNCVGAGNYRSFFAFIALGSVLAWTYVVFVVKVLIDFGFFASPFMILSGIYALFLAIFVSALWGSHIALVSHENQ